MAKKLMGNAVTDLATQKVADGAAAGSAFLAGTAWIADVEPIITSLAGLVAIVAGAAAAWYHIERARYMRRKNSEEE
jgi:hypothetical protein